MQHFIKACGIYINFENFTFISKSANHNSCRLLCHLLVILKVIFANCGPRSDCSYRGSLTWVHTVCLYAKIGLKMSQDAGFLGVLRATLGGCIGTVKHKL